MESNGQAQAQLKEFDDLLLAVARPTERVVASFKCSPDFDINLLDAALLRYFKLDIGDEWLVDAEGCVESEAMRRALVLCLDLMQAGGFPIFDMPLMSCVNAAGEGVKKFELQMQWVFGATPEIYQRAVSNALKITLALGVKHDPAFPRHAQERLNRTVVLPIQQTLRFSPSTLPILREMHRCDIPYEHLGRGVFRLGWGSRGRLHYRSASSGDAALSLQLVQNKEVTANVLRQAGLPSPDHFRVTTIAEAQSAAAHLGFPVVLKPLDRDRGEGVVVDIYDRDDLQRAFSATTALVGGAALLVERQVPGVCHRLFVVGDDLLYGIKRSPVSVTGDGTSAISELIAQAEASRSCLPPWRRRPGPVLDEEVANFLRKSGFSGSDTPADGEVIPLRRIESMALGGVSIDVTRDVHPDNIELAVLAARALGLEVAGIDLMTEDISVAWHQNGAIINEVNFAPTLGTGPTSQPYLYPYVSKLVAGNGKIPVELCSGLEDAVKRLELERVRGQRWVFLTPTQAVKSDSSSLHIPLTSMASRLRALLSRDSVDGILISLT